MLAVQMFESMGRGVVSSVPIQIGQVVEVCEILVLSQSDTIAVNQTDLKYYTFKLDEERDCLVLGLGEIYNHDDKANVSYAIETVSGRLCMVFRALSDIDQGSQLFINYAADTKVSASDYFLNKSLIA